MFLSPISKAANNIQIILPLIDHCINGHCLFMFIHLVKNKVFLCGLMNSYGKIYNQINPGYTVLKEADIRKMAMIGLMSDRKSAEEKSDRTGCTQADEPGKEMEIYDWRN